jgi:chemotaxis response regulator CheB
VIRITVIEDYPETVKEVATILLSMGKEIGIQPITTAPFFDSEIEKDIAQFKPELIILDLLLVDTVESGFRVLAQIKRSNLLSTIPVLVFSSFIGEEQGKQLQDKASRLGAAGAIRKNKADLTKWLEVHVSQTVGEARG